MDTHRPAHDRSLAAGQIKTILGRIQTDIQEIIGLNRVLSREESRREDEDGRPEPSDSEEGLVVLRWLVRSMLRSHTADDGTVWVMPSGPCEVERTAAYLAAAYLFLRGADARPWLWATRPADGRCVDCAAVLSAGGAPLTRRRHPTRDGSHTRLQLNHQLV